MTPLRQRFLDEMRLGNYAPRTIEAYLAALVQLSRYFHLAPDRLTAEQVRDFQLHLVARNVSWSKFNQVGCALRFFYARVLKRTAEQVPFVRFAKKPKSLPVVLSPGEVKRLIDAEDDPTRRTMYRTAYACGLRIRELLALKMADIDSERMLLWVRGGNVVVVLLPRLIYGGARAFLPCLLPTRRFWHRIVTAGRAACNERDQRTIVNAFG